jgi:hypothetical protein
MTAPIETLPNGWTRAMPSDAPPPRSPGEDTAERLGINRPAPSPTEVQRRLDLQEQLTQQLRSGLPKYQGFGQALLGGLNDLGMLTSSAFEAVGEVTGAESLAEAGRYGRETFEERNLRQGEDFGERGKFADIRSVGDALGWARQTAGNLIPVMAPSFAAGLATGGAGTVGAVAGAFVPSATLGVGEVQATMKGKDPTSEADGWVFAGGTAIGALDSILPGKVGSQLIRVFGREGAEEIAMRTLLRPASQTILANVAKEAGKNAMIEGVTESLQESIGEVFASKAAEQDIDWNSLPANMLESFAAGALMGGGVGGATGAAESIQGGRQFEDIARARRERVLPALTDDDRASPFADSMIQQGKAKIAEVLGESPVSSEPPVTPAPTPAATPNRFVREPAQDQNVAIDSFMQRVRGAESGGDDTARNPRSSATGRYQFTDQTWLSSYKQRFGDQGLTDAQILAKRGDGEIQDQLMRDLTEANAAALRRAGVPINEGNLYLAHFAGSDGARRIHEADPGASVESVLGAAVVRANPFLKDMTASEMIAWADGKMGGEGITPDSRPSQPQEAEEAAEPETQPQDRGDAASDLQRILGEDILEPRAGERVEVTQGGETVPGTVEEVWERDGRRGVRIRQDDGVIFDEALDDAREYGARITRPVTQNESESRNQVDSTPGPQPEELPVEQAGAEIEPQQRARQLAIELVRRGESTTGFERNGDKWSFGTNLVRRDGDPFRAKGKITIELNDARGQQFAFTEKEIREAARQAEQPSQPEQTPAESAPSATDAGVQLTPTESGKGLAITGATPAQLEAIAQAVPKAKGVPRKDGAVVYSKKHEAKIREALQLEQRPRDVDAVRAYIEANPGWAATPASARAAAESLGLTPQRMGSILASDLGMTMGDTLAGGVHVAEAAAAARRSQDSGKTVETQSKDSGETTEPAFGTAEYHAQIDADFAENRKVMGNFKKGDEVAWDHGNFFRDGSSRTFLGKVVKISDKEQGIIEVAGEGGGSWFAAARRLRKRTPQDAQRARADEEKSREPRGETKQNPPPDFAGTVERNLTREQVEAAAAIFDRAEERARKPKTEPSPNRLVTDERAAELRERLKAKLNPNRLNSGIDPEIVAIGTELAVYHIEKGARRFTAWAKAVAADLDMPLESLRRYLRSWYNGARDMMEDSGESVAGMDTADEVGKAMRTFAEWASEQETPARSETAQVAPVETTPEAMEQSRQVELLAERFLAGDRFASITEARKALSDMTGLPIRPGTAEAKRADETIEAAVVEAARTIVGRNRGNPLAAYRALVDLYDRQPNLTVRSSTSVEQQAYSTPVPLAFLASERAGINRDSTVYEPTAGNGALLIASDPAKTVANELNPDRAAMLEASGAASVVTQADATTFLPREKFDAVIANPPFGPIKGEDGENVVFDLGRGYQTREIDHAIAIKALEAMKDDGRAVLLVGGINKQIVDPKKRRDAYNGKAKREFYYRLYSEYNVTDHFTVAGELYAKQGAGWPVDVIVIEGRGKSALPLPAVQAPRVLDSWNALEGEIDGRQDVQGPAREQTGDADLESVEPQRGDDGDRGSSGSGRTDRQQQRPEAGQPGAIRERPAAGEPGSEGLAERPARNDARPAQADRDRAGGGTPDVEARQVPYRPASGAQALDTLVPVNMQTATGTALERLQDSVGNVDYFVADRLGYDPDEIGDYFSAEQVDALALALDNMERGAGFIIGDQTGIGKGRVVAGVIRYALKSGRMPIFVTEKPTLYADMYRDMNDIGIPDMLGRPVEIVMTNAAEKVPLDEAGTEVLKTPAAVTHNAFLNRIADGDREGVDVLFTTYAQMQALKGELTPRQRAIQRLAPGSILIFDESHNAGGQGKQQIKKKGAAPNRAEFARQIAKEAHGVFFSSATYAKRPEVMDLYASTDMHKAVADIENLAEAIIKGGIPMQQVVASTLAEAGQYVRRERSFEGVDYRTPPVNVSRKSYSQFTGVLRGIQDFQEEHIAEIKEAIDEEVRAEAQSVSPDGSVGGAGAISTNFTSVMHNVVEQMLLALKAGPAADMAIEALKNGQKPVITLANTMGSFLEEYAEEHDIGNGQPMPLDFRQLLIRYLDRTRRVTIKKPFSSERAEIHIISDRELGEDGVAAYNAVRQQIEAMDLNDVPVSPVDAIRHRIREAGYSVGEITGRSATLDYSGGVPTYRIRPGKESSITGKRDAITRFNDGRLDVMILNQSGSTGLSLHASEKFKDQRPRRMIIAQAERNIDTHMQMLGRIHRTGQIVLPSYDQLVASVPAEMRPAAVLAKKMASLNANTTGARDSAMTGEDVPDFMNQYGDEIAARLMEEDTELHRMLGTPLKESEGEEEGLNREDAARRVTGRLMLLPLEEQEAFYDRFLTDYQDYLAQKEAAGEAALEAKTLDLDAKSLARSQVIAPTDPTSPFGEGVYLEALDVKRQTKPIPPEAVLSEIAQGIGATVPDDVPDSQALADLQAKGKLWANEFRGEHMADFDAWAREQIDNAEEKKAAGLRERLDGNRQQFATLLRDVYPGAVLAIDGPNGEFEAIVLEVEKKGERRNPLALGAFRAHLALASGGRMTLPFSQLEDQHAEEDIFSYRIRPVSEIDGEPPLRAFEQESTARESRIMFTGNILAAFEHTLGKGQIVNFTREDGSIQPGILMGKGYDYQKDMAKRPVAFRTAAQVAEWLRRGEKVFGEGVSLEVLGSQLIATAVASKSAGGKYYLNTGVRDAVGGDFYKKSTGMVATTSPSKAEAVADALMKAGAVFTAKTKLDEARAIIAGGEAPRFQIAERRRGGNWADALAGREEKLRTELEAQLAAFGLEDKIMLRAARGLDLGKANVQAAYWSGVISIALDKASDPQRTIAHETVHALRDLGLFTAEEWRSLVNAAWNSPRFRRWAERNYAGQKLADIQEEAAAEMFADHWRNLTVPNATLWARAARRIYRFIVALAAAVNKVLGRPNNDALQAVLIQNGIMSGEIGRREVGSGERRPEIYGQGGGFGKRRVRTAADAGWTRERIDQLLRQYAVGHAETKTKSYVAWVTPQQFLDVTSPASSQERVREEAGDLDVERLTRETQTPFLIVEEDQPRLFATTGHEGRHRMAALEKAGVERVPIVVMRRDIGWSDLEPMPSALLFAQRHTVGVRGEKNIILENLMPLTYANREAIQSEFGQGQVRFQATDAATFADPETESRWQDAKRGIGDDGGVVEKAREWWADLTAGFTRHWRDLPNEARFSDVQQQFRKLEAAPDAAMNASVRYLRNLVGKMDKAEYDLFSRKVVLDDLGWDAGEGRNLPFGFTPETLREERAKIDALIDANPKLVEALRERKKHNREIAEAMVRSGVLTREQIRNPAYFRHMVLDYARHEARMARGTGSKIKSPYWARRMGSTLDINANLLEAELDWLQKAQIDIATADTIEWLKNSDHNIRERLRNEAKATNKANVAEKIAGNELLEEEEQLFRTRIAQGLAMVKKEIEAGSLGEIPSHLETAASNLAKNVRDGEAPFALLAWILDNNLPGAMGAGMVLKYTGLRKAWMRRLLGESYLDPDDVDALVRRLKPEGYKAWQPREGRHFFTAKTISESALDMFVGKLSETAYPGVERDELHKALTTIRPQLVVGGDRYTMVLPVEIADTLTEFGDRRIEGMVARVFGGVQAAWKRWILINPRRFLKYNINNLSGDLDAIIAGNPGTLTKLGSAWRELRAAAKGDPSERYNEALKRGVFTSGLSVQEIPDINRLSAVRHLTEDRSRVNQLTIGMVANAWRALQDSTNFRESLFRMAAYLDYIEKIEAGTPQLEIGYGASIPRMVDAVRDPKDKAALLARDLVGDYGAISVAGGWLRKYLIPFWSWMEINTRRYWRLTNNAFSTSKARGLAVGGLLGAGIAARTAAALAIRMGMFYGLLWLWNNLLFGDEEDDLGELQKRQMHLILGRNADGEVITLRTQGALSDVLGMLGFPDAVAGMKKYLDGQGTIGQAAKDTLKAPANRVLTSTTPIFSVPLEQALGQELWPDIFEPREIKDRWRHVFSTFSLENEYDLLADKPSRGYARSWEESLLYRRDPGEMAYDTAKSIAYDWLEDVKGQGGFGSSSPRSLALRDYRLSLRYDDPEGADEALARYAEFEGTEGGLRASIKRQHPLGPIAKKDRAAFLDSLTDEQLEIFADAEEWYRRVYLGEEPPEE